MTDASRMRADSWSASDWTLPEWQCRRPTRPATSPAALPAGVSKEVDPVSRQIGSFRMEWLRSVD